MQLTRFTDYSFRVLIYLGSNPGRLATIDEIAAAYDVSRNHLMKVVTRLAAAGYIETVRGKGGGMRLARPADEITIGDVARDTEENMDIVECFDVEFKGCPLVGSCALKSALLEASRNFLATLDGYRLSDLLPATRPARSRAVAPLTFHRRK